MKPKLLFLAKFALAAASLGLVFYEINVPQMMDYLTAVHPFYLFLCAAALTLGQIVSAFRMRYYFGAEGLEMSRHFAIRLYFMGAFFNQMLPGGIGGDGYKIFLVSHLHGFSKLTAFLRMLSNRASGLFLLILLTAALAFSSRLVDIIPYASWLISAGIILLFPCYFISARILLKEPIAMALKAAEYSLVVQGLCIVSAYALFIGMGLDKTHVPLVADYLVLFMISSIVSVLPISIGGAGLRELTFLYGTHLMGLDKEFGIAFSLTYFMVNLLISLPGGYFFMTREHKKEAPTHSIVDK
ncbi:MAG: hypothetical protein K0R63_1282 [Rickettsiales bacterium]|jgi:uncharacterized membrane protein YbhN (UPF0104 family)|nr:hypothetical protein [Rickettsiales bacterium]